jgi:hypothetical protein
LFLQSDPENNWIRVPVINYLRACPLDKAKEAIAKLEEIDPESVKRANTFFSIPVPARDTQPTSNDASSVAKPADSIATAALIPAQTIAQKPGAKFAAVGLTKAAVSPKTGLIGRSGRAARPQDRSLANLLELAFVIGVAVSTLMIAQFLLLTGGTLPQLEPAPVANETT